PTTSSACASAPTARASPRPAMTGRSRCGTPRPGRRPWNVAETRPSLPNRHQTRADPRGIVMTSLQLFVPDGDTLRLQRELAAPLELGRQRAGEPEPSTQDPCPLLPASASGPARLIVAGNRESNVSRQHALLEPLPSGRVRVTNK